MFLSHEFLGPYIMYLEGAVNEISRSQSRSENRDA